MHSQKNRIIWPFLLPALILYGVFVLFPYGRAVYLSFTSWSGVSNRMPWVGLENYERLLKDQRFLDALSRNGQLLLVLPTITILIALLFATLFVQGGKGVPGSGFFRVVFFFPQVMSAVVVAMLFSYIYHPNQGLLNSFLKLVGLGSLTRAWLGDAKVLLWAVAAVAIWSSIGFYMVVFVAGMQSIPTSFYEAAVLDGASRFRQFRDITLPLLWETIRTAVIYLAIAALDFFTLIQVMTGGGSAVAARKSEVAALYMYNEAFGRSRWGSASAVGVILLILTLFLSVIVMRVTKRETYEF